jgi:hypothetical protein
LGQTTGTLAVTVTLPLTVSTGVPTIVSTPITSTASPGGFVVVATLSVPDAAADFSGPRVFSDVADATGSVSFSGLPFGIYSVCVEPQDGIHVSPCQWTQPPTVHLTNQQVSGTINLILQPGIPVDIRIDDPNLLLSQGIDAGIATPQGHQHLIPIVQDPFGANYRMIAPFGVAASVDFLLGAGLDLLDNSGNDYSPLSAAAAFNLATTDLGKTFRYTLRKRN